jgi:hypothetical protein
MSVTANLTTNVETITATIVVEDETIIAQVSAAPRGPAGEAGAAGPNALTTATTTNLTGFISGNGTNISGATAAATTATANTLVLRSATGGASFSGLNTNSGSYAQIGGENFNVATTASANLTATGSGTVIVSGAGGTTISGGALTISASSATFATGSIATSQPLTLTQTWTNAAVTYTGLQVNITDSGPSNAASLLADFQVGGSSRFTIGKTGFTFRAATIFAGISSDGSGRILLNSSTAGGVRVSGDLQIGLSDTVLLRDAANTLAQRNGTAQQESRIYGTYTGPGNYRRLALKMDTAGVAQIVAEGGGAGASGNRLEFVTGGATRMTVAADGNITASGTVTGASGAFGNWTLGADILATTPGGSVQVSGVGSFRFGGAGERIYNSGSAIKIRNAANTLDAALTCSDLTASGSIKTGGYTFATLPTPTTGMRAYITDGAAIPVFMANAAGGGSTVTPVFYNGTNWINA